MTVGLEREGWLQLFVQMRRPVNFLSRFFTVKPGGIYNGDKVAIDIQRFDEDVAIAVKKCTGPNLNTIDVFTTKEFTPPAFAEAITLDVCSLINRTAGVDPYSDAYNSYFAQATQKIMTGFMLIDDKIQRAVELQASQVLQTGMINLLNAAGDTSYEIDFKPKATHFPTVTTAWSDPSADILGDLESLAEVIRADGKIDPNTLILDSLSLNNMLNNTVIKERADIRRYNLVQIDPRFANSGATFYGTMFGGSYEFSIWTYPETYKDPQTEAATKYIQPNKCVMLSDRTRLDLVSARVPPAFAPDPRVSRFLPGRVTSRSQGIDVTPNIYASTNGKQMMGELESRPLCVPVQIDGFGCLTTTV